MRNYQQTRNFYLGEYFRNTHIDRYFTWERYPKGFWYFFSIALPLTIFLGFLGYWWLFAVGAVLLLLVLTIFILRARSIPTQRQYDEWLERLENYLDTYSRDRLRREHSKRVPKGLCIQSFVPPDSDLSSRYSVTKVLWKQGKDGISRFSFIVYTFFYPTEGYVAVYTYRVNVLNDYEVVPEKYRAYSYTHIVEITIVTGRDSASFHNRVYSFQTERISLRAIHDDIKIGAYISIEPLGNNSEQAPLISVNIDPIINHLNGIVISKWR